MSGFLKIDDSLVKKVKKEIRNDYPGREIKANPNGWHKYRYIQVETPIQKDFGIHYEYTRGYVELHLEKNYADRNSKEYQIIAAPLKSLLPNETNFGWHNWKDRQKGAYRYEKQVENFDQLMEYMGLLIEKVDKVILSLLDQPQTVKTTPEVTSTESEPIPTLDEVTVTKLEYSIKFITDINFNELNIPEYQRPYKWTVKNVNQLIDDILAFKDKSSYRLGSLVLYNNDIVDGQQRIITLSLLLHQLFEKFIESDNTPYSDFYANIQKFWLRTQFKNPYSIANVRKNINLINERLSDLDMDFFNYLMEKCQFVVIQLPNITEAFQFFDSQNTRGKELNVHDLLKAFHLREIDQFTSHDSANINHWQEQDSKELVKLFLVMYRVKRWSKGATARYLTSKNVDAFKGISLKALMRYPFYMQQIVCHFFAEDYRSNPARQIDRSPLEFPFQLDQVCINGSRFFDMVNHYDQLYKKIRNVEEYKDFPKAQEILNQLNNYKLRSRIGDIYIRELFDTLLFYYTDRFGFVEMDKAVVKFFKFAYKMRLKHFSIQLATIDKAACEGSLFSTIRDAMKPSDVLNLHHNKLPEKECQGNSEEIKKMYYNN